MFSTRLRELRKKANLTQIEFAKSFNVANGTVGNWESGNRQPDHSTLLKLADFFDVSVDYLLGNDTNKTILNERIKVLLDESCPDDYTTFSDALSVPVSTVMHWYKGVSSSCYNYIDKIAGFFNVSVDYLLGRTDSHAPIDENLEGVDFAIPLDDLINTNAQKYSNIINEEKTLLNKYRTLSLLGKAKANGYIDDLLKVSEYKIPLEGKLSVSPSEEIQNKKKSSLADYGEIAAEGGELTTARKKRKKETTL